MLSLTILAVGNLTQKILLVLLLLLLTFRQGYFRELTRRCSRWCLREPPQRFSDLGRVLSYRLFHLGTMLPFTVFTVR